MNGATELELQRWSRSLRPARVLSLTLLPLALIGLPLWLRGARFYGLAPEARVEHVDYAQLSPSRATGSVYGALALALILLNLAYLLRRRFPQWPLGRMRLWLHAHVVSGLAAGLFAAFHTAFQLRSPVAVLTAVALGVTLVSGIVGRSCHALAPSCERLLGARLRDLDALVPGLAPCLQEELARRPVRPPAPGAGLLRVLGALPVAYRAAALRRELVLVIFAHWVHRAPALERAHARPLAREVAALAAREVYAAACRELLRAWRPWHRAAAITLAAGVLLHVGVALYYGYGWNFAP